VSLNLLVGGRRPPGASLSCADLDAVETAAVPSDAFVVARCDDPRDLVGVVAATAQTYGPIDMLDLFDHGGPGHIRMGSALLFASDADPASELLGRDIASCLSPFLTDTAHVRLLGCDTALLGDPAAKEGLASRLLLVKLARALGGHRVVFGTLTGLGRLHFGPRGFGRDREEAMLFSSLAAIDIEPPDEDVRGAELQRLRPPQYNPYR
jgi:hypothetical protein